MSLANPILSSPSGSDLTPQGESISAWYTYPVAIPAHHLTGHDEAGPTKLTVTK